MKTVLVDNPITVTVPLVDDEGTPVTPTALSYRVLDENDEELRAPEAIADLTGTDKAITVAQAYNSEPGGRVVELTITHAGGTSVQTVIYGVIEAIRLEYATNTFQTLAKALMTARDMPSVGTFAAGAKTAQEAALIEAFNRLTRLNYLIPAQEVVDSQDRVVPDWASRLTPRMWSEMTPALLDGYPSMFLAALRKAQIAEANDIMTGDPFKALRAGGLLSKTVGESSMMFRTGVRALELPVNRAAFDYLTGYLDNRMTITRV